MRAASQTSPRARAGLVALYSLGKTRSHKTIQINILRISLHLQAFPSKKGSFFLQNQKEKREKEKKERRGGGVGGLKEAHPFTFFTLKPF